MAYTKQTWNIGETLSAEKFNHLENGVPTHFLMVTFEEDGTSGVVTCSDSYTEAKTAMDNGIPVLCNIHIFNQPYNNPNEIKGSFLMDYSASMDCLKPTISTVREYRWYPDGSVDYALR